MSGVRISKEKQIARNGENYRKASHDIVEIKIETATLNQVHVSVAITSMSDFLFFSSQGQLEVFSSTEKETRCCNYRQRVLRRKLMEIRGKFLSGIVAQVRKNLLHLRKFSAFSREKSI